MLSFPPSPSVRIFVAREAIDMRKGLDGLAGLVIDVIDQDPQSGHLWVPKTPRASFGRECVAMICADPASA